MLSAAALNNNTNGASVKTEPSLQLQRQTQQALLRQQVTQLKQLQSSMQQQTMPAQQQAK